MGNHVEQHLELALEIISLISGAIDSDDVGVAGHLAGMARDRASLLYERLELVRAEVLSPGLLEHVERMDRVLNRVLPLRRLG